jgi:hypothetical protein
VACDELIACAAEVRGLIDELVTLTGADHAWGVRTLRRNTEIALRNPKTLERPENQMDFVEEMAEAVWGAAEPGFRSALGTGVPTEQIQLDRERLQAIMDRLDGLAVLLCGKVTDWRRQVSAAAGETPRSAARSPQASHWI